MEASVSIYKANMEGKMKRLKKYATMAFIVAVFGEIYFYPFNNGLRLSVGVIILALFLLLNEDISEIYFSVFCGITVFFLRSSAALIFTSTDFSYVIYANSPSILFYVCYGVLTRVTGLKEKKDNVFQAALILAFAGSFANTAEAVVRGQLDTYMIRFIIMADLIRSSTAYFIYWFYNRQRLYIINREHQIRYTQLNMLVSNIQAEMFYLKKSMKDIENVMGKSYSLHQDFKENRDIKERALDIAREVHEIKKDYYRVIKGFEAFMEDFQSGETMTLSSIFTIIKDNTERYLKESGKDIRITFSQGSDFSIGPYYSMFTIINNLIINSIDACGNGDYIKVVERDDAGSIYFEISDTGEGIIEDILLYIFNPGFTTKFDPSTGKASTGIGLSHVKSMVEELGGSIDVKSEVNKGTEFIIKIPGNSLKR